MPMRPCDRCSENYWSFEKIEDIVQATCHFCGHEVEFEARQPGEMRTGDKCPKCPGVLKIVPSKFNRKKLDKAYYYTHIAKCGSCRRIFLQERFKVINVDKPNTTPANQP